MTRHVSEDCEFEVTLEEMLRDRLVCSVQDEHIQRGLLPEKGLDCKKAMEIAHGMEVAAKNATDIQAMNASVFPQGREEKVH